MDEKFERFCSDDSASIEALLLGYADLFSQAFFNVEEQGPFVSDAELRRWLCWCLYYGKPRDEYPPANHGEGAFATGKLTPD